MRVTFTNITDPERPSYSRVYSSLASASYELADLCADEVAGAAARLFALPAGTHRIMVTGHPVSGLGVLANRVVEFTLEPPTELRISKAGVLWEGE